MIIDGFTQFGSSSNTLANGENAVLLIAVTGTNKAVVGFDLLAGNSIVRGLAVRRLWQDEPARFKRLMLLWRRMVADHLKATLPGSGRRRRGTADA